MRCNKLNKMDSSGEKSKSEPETEAGGGQVRGDDSHLKTEPGRNNTHADPESLDPEHTDTNQDVRTEPHQGGPVAVSSEGHRMGSGSSASWRDDDRGEDPTSCHADLNAGTKAGDHDEEDKTSTPAPQGKSTPEMGAASNLNNDQISCSNQTNNASMITSVLSNGEDKSQDQSSVTVGSSAGARKSSCTRLASSESLEKEQYEDSAESNHCADGATSSSTSSLGHVEDPTSPPVTSQPHAASLQLHQNSAQPKKDTTWHGKSKGRKSKSRRKKQKAKQTDAVPSDHPNSGPDQVHRGSEKHPADSRQKKKTSEQDENEATTPSHISEGKGIPRSKKSTDARKTAHQQPGRTSLRTQSSKPDTETGDTTSSSAISCTHQQVSQDTEDTWAHLSCLDQTKQVNESGEMKEATHASKTEESGSHPTETPTGTSAGQQQSYNSSLHHGQVPKPNSPQGAIPPSASVSSSTQQFSQDATHPKVCLSSFDQMNKPGDTHSTETEDKASGHLGKTTDAQLADHQHTDRSSPLRQSSKPDSEAGAMTPSPATILPEHQQSDPGQDSRASKMDQSNRNQMEDVAKEAQGKAETSMEETKREGNHHSHEEAANISSSFKEELSELSQQGNTSPAVVSSFQDKSMATQNITEQGLSVEDSGLGDTSVISASRFPMETLPTTPPSDSTADGDASVWAAGKEQRKDDEMSRISAQAEDDEMSRNGAQTEDDEMSRNGAQSEGDEMARISAQTEDDEMSRNGAQAEDDEMARNGAQTGDNDVARNGAQTGDNDGARNGAQTKGDSVTRDGSETADDKMTSNGAPTDDHVDAGTGPQPEGDGVAGRRAELTLTGEDQIDSGSVNVRSNVKSGGFPPLPKDKTSTPVPRGKNAPKTGAASNLKNDQTSRSKQTNNASKKSTDAGETAHQQPDRTSRRTQAPEADTVTGDTTSSSAISCAHHEVSQNTENPEAHLPCLDQTKQVNESEEMKEATHAPKTEERGSHPSSFQDQSMGSQNLSVEDSGLGHTSVISDSSRFLMETLPTTPPSDSTEKPDSVQHTCDDREDIIRSLQQEKQKLQGEVLSLKTLKDEQMSFVHNLQEENKKIRGEVLSLKTQEDKQKKIAHNLQEENKKIRGELANVRKQYDEQTDKRQHLQEEKQELQENLNSLQSHLTEKVAELERQQQELQKLHEDLDNVSRANIDQGDNIYHLQQENQQLQGELANVNKEYDEQTDKIQHLQQEKQELQEKSASLQSHLREKVTALEHQQQESQKLRDNSNRLKAQVREQMAKFQRQQQELHDLREKSAGLEKLSEDQAAAFQHQQQEVNTLREKMACYDRTCNDQNFTINQLRKEKETLHEKAAALEIQYNQQMERVQHLESELQRFRGETSRLQLFETKCQEKDGDIRQLRQRIRQLEDEVGTVRSQLVEKEKHLHGIMDAIANNTKEKEKAVAENRQHFNRLQEVLGEIKHFQDHAEASRKRELVFRTQVVFRTIINRTYRSSMENLKQQNGDMQGELNNYRRKCDAQQLNLTDALNQVMENKTKLVNMEQTHTQERRELRGTISEMNDELDRLRREVQHLTEDRDAARVECNHLTDAVEEMEAEKRQWLAEKDQKEDQIQQIEKERDELMTNCKVLERRRQTAQEQSVKFGEETTRQTMLVNQLQTMYVEKERHYQDAVSAHSNLERNLREQLRDKEQQVVPLEIEAKRATLELRNVRTQLDNMEREKENLEITVNALKEELERSNAAVTEFQRTEDRLRQEMAEQHTQKLRFIKEKQECQRDIRSLLEEVNRLKMRRN